MRRGKRIPAIQRFLEKIEINPWGLGCWNWTGKTAGTKSTYGQLSFQSKYIYAHRFIWEFVNGPIPEGMEIDHLCRNTICVNPMHLEPVDPDENSRRARKTICVNGHDLTKPENQRIENGKHRGCYVCVKERQLRYYHQRKALL